MCASWYGYNHQIKVIFWSYAICTTPSCACYFTVEHLFYMIIWQAYVHYISHVVAVFFNGCWSCCCFGWSLVLLTWHYGSTQIHLEEKHFKKGSWIFALWCWCCTIFGGCEVWISSSNLGWWYLFHIQYLIRLFCLHCLTLCIFFWFWTESHACTHIKGERERERSLIFLEWNRWWCNSFLVAFPPLPQSRNCLC